MPKGKGGKKVGGFHGSLGRSFRANQGNHTGGKRTKAIISTYKTGQAISSRGRYPTSHPKGVHKG